ncbi:MAG: S-adenosyl-l-methionine hydroxide adenosyltransferase family protein [Alphaproteobacteria bacterium]
MILLFTDFGLAGPYVGQMHSVLAAAAPGIPVIDLMHDAPPQDPRRASCLLAALADYMPADAVCVAVVDPGVGGDRPPVLLEADGRRFVGPGNGLLEPVARRAARHRWWRITWRPAVLSRSFHGRDLFAPAGGRLAAGATPSELGEPCAEGGGTGWPDDLSEVIYIDGFGNAMTGLRADGVAASAVLLAGGRRLTRADTFGAVPEGEAFWYANSIGLVEIAVNCGSAAQSLGLGLGSRIALQTG